MRASIASCTALPHAFDPDEAERPLFGRDVDEIIEAYLEPGGRADETDLEIDVRKAMPGICEQIDDADLTDEVLARMREALNKAVDLDARMPLFWIMFAEPTDRGSEFAGVYVTRGLSFEHAVFSISVGGNSPGSRADGAALPLGMPIDEAWLGRLLSYAEATALREIIDAQTN